MGAGNGGLEGERGGFSALMVGVLVCVEDVVPLLVLGLEFGLECGRLVRERRERIEPTSESDSSPLST
jgi:cytochrome c oxidase assembly factor CtaG